MRPKRIVRALTEQERRQLLRQEEAKIFFKELKDLVNDGVMVLGIMGGASFGIAVARTIPDMIEHALVSKTISRDTADTIIEVMSTMQEHDMAALETLGKVEEKVMEGLEKLQDKGQEFFRDKKLPFPVNLEKLGLPKAMVVPSSAARFVKAASKATDPDSCLGNPFL